MNPKVHLIHLVQLVKADENIDPAELELIEAYAKKYQLSIEEAINAPVPELAPPEKLKSWYHLLYTSLVDGEISPKESAILMEIGANMGLEPLALRQVIELSHENGAIPLTDEELTTILE